MACDECGGALVPDDRHDELVCSQCGTVSPEPLELPPREAPDTPSKYETKDAPLLGTMLRLVRFDARGRPLSGKEYQRARNLRRTHELQTDRFTRYPRKTEKAIQEIADILQAPDWAMPDALVLHRRVLEQPMTFFPIRRALATALLVTALRARGLPAPLQLVAGQAGIRFKDLVNALKSVRRLVPEARVSANIPALAHYFATRLGHHQLAGAAAQVAQGMSSVNQNPIAVAAAACVIALRQNHKRMGSTDAARVAGLAEGTVRRIIQQHDASEVQAQG